MGTRSLIHIKSADRNSATLVTIYRQYDGYPSGLGQDIKKILDGGGAVIVDGYNSEQQIPTHFNGMSCLAAHLIGELKGQTIGGIYIETPDASDCGEEFVYVLYLRDGAVHVRCANTYGDGSLIYEGPLADWETSSD